MRRDIQLNPPQTGMPDLCPTVLPVHLPPLAVGSVSPAVYPALHVIYCAGNGWTRLVSGQRRDVNSRGCLVQSRRRAIQTQQRPIRTRRQLIQTRGRDIRTRRRLVRSQRSPFSAQQPDISGRRNGLNHNAFSKKTGSSLFPMESEAGQSGGRKEIARRFIAGFEPGREGESRRDDRTTALRHHGPRRVSFGLARSARGLVPLHRKQLGTSAASTPPSTARHRLWQPPQHSQSPIPHFPLSPRFNSQPSTLVLRREAASTRLPALNSQPSTLNPVPSNA